MSYSSFPGSLDFLPLLSSSTASISTLDITYMPASPSAQWIHIPHQCWATVASELVNGTPVCSKHRNAEDDDSGYGT